MRDTAENACRNLGTGYPVTDMLRAGQSGSLIVKGSHGSSRAAVPKQRLYRITVRMKRIQVIQRQAADREHAARMCDKRKLLRITSSSGPQRLYRCSKNLTARSICTRTCSVSGIVGHVPEKKPAGSVQVYACCMFSIARISTDVKPQGRNCCR